MEVNKPREKILSRFINEHPESASSILMKSQPSQIAQLVNSITTESSIASLLLALELLPVNLLEESLALLSDQKIVNIIKKLEMNLVGSLFHQWKMKKRIDKDRLEGILTQLDDELSSSIRMILKYPIDSIGNIMTPTPFCVREDVTAGELLSLLKKQKNRYSRYIYIIDESSCLIGVIPFKDLFYAKTDTLISSLMSHDVFFLKPEDNIKDIYELPCWKKWDRVPIVNKDKFIVGLLKLDNLESYISQKQNLINHKNHEISQAGNAIGEVFQIGIAATVSAIMLPIDKSKKYE